MNQLVPGRHTDCGALITEFAGRTRDWDIFEPELAESSPDATNQVSGGYIASGHAVIALRLSKQRGVPNGSAPVMRNLTVIANRSSVHSTNDCTAAREVCDTHVSFPVDFIQRGFPKTRWKLRTS